MPKHLLTIISLLTSVLYGQKLTIDTVNAYEYSSMVYTTQGGVTYCNINGGKYPASYCEKLFNNPLVIHDDEHPKLHFVKMYTIEDTLLYTTYMIDIEVQNFGPYREYYSDSSLKIKGQFLFFGDQVEKYYEEKNINCKTGKWYYYRPNGELYKIEIYRKNKLIKVKGMTKESKKN